MTAGNKLMSFDIAAVRQEFWRLDRAHGALRTDRIPTREDIFARWHWDMEQKLLNAGMNPGKEDVGRLSAMIGGRGRCQPWKDEQPLEKRFRYAPMSLPWFDHPDARHVFVKPDPDHRFLHALSAGHLAGYSRRPSGHDLFRQMTVGMRTELERDFMAELLCDIREEDYPQLRRQDALSVWHMARTVLDCGVLRGALSRWLNQFAVRPTDWQETVPGEDR